MNKENGDVLIIYTGGTIGSVRQDPDNLESPLVPGNIEDLIQSIPAIKSDRIVFRNRVVKLDITETAIPKDSSAMEPSDWLEIAEIIEKSYDLYKGFVIIHGTDTMAYTASALSFMFDGLTKPVILTGSQRPIGETRSDAVQNLVTAIEFAAAEVLEQPVIAEVCLFFGDKLLRGCRTTKTDVNGYSGFTSPNMLPLATAGDHIEYNYHLFHKTNPEKFGVNKKIMSGIALIELSPLMSYDILEKVLSTEGLKGVVLKSYGAGNAPTDKRFLDIIKNAIGQGIIIIDITQCHSGTTNLGLYEVSAGLLASGVLSGIDMTSEAAQTKLAVLLGGNIQSGPPEELMQVNLKGEMDKNIFDLDFGKGEASPRASYTTKRKLSGNRYFNSDSIEQVKLVFADVQVESDLNLFVSVDDQNFEHVKVEKNETTHAEKALNLFINLTNQIKNLQPSDDFLSIFIKTDEKSICWNKLFMSITTS